MHAGQSGRFRVGAALEALRVALNPLALAGALHGHALESSHPTRGAWLKISFLNSSGFKAGGGFRFAA